MICFNIIFVLTFFFLFISPCPLSLSPCRDYIQLLEESASRRETRLRQDHQEALQQYEQRLKQLQEDYSTQQDQQQQRGRQMATEHNIQLQQLQQNHRYALHTNYHSFRVFLSWGMVVLCIKHSPLTKVTLV